MTPVHLGKFSPHHFTSMATEDLLIQDGSYRQAIETVSKGLPQSDIVSLLACGTS